MRSAYEIARSRTTFGSAKNQIKALQPSPHRRSVKRTTGSFEKDNLNSKDRVHMICAARDAELNFDLARGLIQRLETFVVGNGNCLQFAVPEHDNLSKTKKNQLKRAEVWYNRSFAEQMDGRARHQLFEAQQAAFRRWYVDGDLGIRHDQDTNQFFIYEADQIVKPIDWDADKYGKCEDGVVLDEYGAATAYVTCPGGQSAYKTSDCTIHDAEHFTLVANHNRFRSVRGFSSLVGSIELLDKLSSYFDHELTKASVISKFGLAVTRTDSSTLGLVDVNNNVLTADDLLTMVEEGESPDYSTLEEIAPGSIEILQPGDKIEEIGGKNSPNSEFTAYTRAMIRIIGAGASVPLELIMLDFSESNFSSNKAAMLLAWAYISGLQHWFNSRFNRWMARKALSTAIGEKKVILPAGWETYVDFTSPGLPEIDRYKAERAKQLALDNSTTTLKAEIAKQGTREDWQDNLQQRHEEAVKDLLLQAERKKIAEEHGLTWPNN